MSFIYNRLSLLLLLMAYFNLGWILSASHYPWWAWLLVVLLILILAEAFASPWAILRGFILRWISTDTKAFFAVTIAAFLTVVILSWFHIFTHLVLLVAAAALARLELQTAGIGSLKAFLILSFFSLIALILGGFGYWSLNHWNLVLLFFNRVIGHG